METTTCPTCKGGGKVDNKEGKPWAEITARPNPRVTSGELLPVSCPECKGRGVKGDKEDGPAAAPDMRTIKPLPAKVKPPVPPAPVPAAPAKPGKGAS